jgi:hypothetical protein
MPDKKLPQQDPEREFQQRLLAAVEKPPTRGIFRVINSAAFLWLCTILFVTIGGATYSTYQQCIREARQAVGTNDKLLAEIRGREAHFSEIVLQSKTLKIVRAQFEKDYYHYVYLEYKGQSTREIREQYYRFLKDNGLPMQDRYVTKSIDEPLASQASLIADGILDYGIKDSDLDILKSYAQKLHGLGEIHLSLRAFLNQQGFDKLEPNCGPRTLYTLALLDGIPPIVRYRNPIAPK